MDGYPNSDEEFELMYGDELELLREYENATTTTDTVIPRTKSRKSLDFISSQTANDINNLPSTSNCTDNSFETDFVPLPSSQPHTENAEITDYQIEQSTSQKEPSKKRTIQELFGEIDDILNEEIIEGTVKKRKSSHCDDLATIDHIVQLRKLAKERQNPIALAKRDPLVCTAEHYAHNISYQIPKYSFIALTNHFGKRVYIRCHSEQYEQEEIKKVAKEGTFAGVMGESFKTIWEEAKHYIHKQLDKENTDSNNSEETSTNPSLSVDNNTDLWVDLYKPHNYFELLSDESTNRTLLKWLKLWDKIVFNRTHKSKPTKSDTFQKFDFNMQLDEHGRPVQKIALLCGPPGLGKTTLAHMVGKQAGYNVVEVNASDERTVDSFRTILENATQMRSVVDKENRPNCVVFDEIDGAPAPSIEFLIKFVTGTAKVKKKKGSKENANLLRRPIICICNDVYVPSLRPLRQIAFVVNFPPTASARLAERLGEIARHQKIIADLGALLALCEKCGNDIRSCLSVLHFFKSLSKAITLSQIHKTTVGQKDIQKGLFSVWQDIFHIELPKHTDKRDNNVQSNLKYRMQKILHAVNSFGDHERLAQGVFENYPNVLMKNAGLESTCEALDWFCYMDVLNRDIMTFQNYILMPYLSYAFVVWHFCFARASWQKLTYPNMGYEVRTKAQKNKGLLNEVMKGMQPKVRAFTYSSSLKLDTLPILKSIIAPPFRPINLHLYTQEEKKDLNNVVCTMIDYNLNYVQERTLEGSYVFHIDPNIEEITTFPGFKTIRTLSYSNKQLIAREIEVEKMRRIESHKTCSSDISTKIDTKLKEVIKPVPNHMQKLQAKVLKPTKEEVVTKDFFGRIVTKTQTTTNKLSLEFNNDVWYQFKEGYSNAVRKKIKISNLM